MDLMQIISVDNVLRITIKRVNNAHLWSAAKVVGIVDFHHLEYSSALFFFR